MAVYVSCSTEIPGESPISVERCRMGMLMRACVVGQALTAVKTHVYDATTRSNIISQHEI